MAGIAYPLWSQLDRYDSEVREYTVHYRITGHDRREGGLTALIASGLPALGSVYTGIGLEPLDPYCVAIGYGSIAPENWEQSREVWRASVKFSTDRNKQRRPAENQDNPLLKPPIISGAGHRRRAAATNIRLTDTQGRKIQNTANEPFPEQEIQVDDSSSVLRITKNVATLDLDQLDDYTDSVNNAQWMGKPARTWKMDPPQWRKVYWGNTAYYEVTYVFQGKKDTWDLQPRNLSEHDINDKRPSASGVLVDGWQPLDSAGEFVIVSGNDEAEFDGQGGNPNAFRWYREKSFPALGLPTNLDGT